MILFPLHVPCFMMTKSPAVVSQGHSNLSTFLQITKWRAAILFRLPKEKKEGDPTERRKKETTARKDALGRTPVVCVCTSLPHPFPIHQYFSIYSPSSPYCLHTYPACVSVHGRVLPLLSCCPTMTPFSRSHGISAVHPPHNPLLFSSTYDL